MNKDLDYILSKMKEACLKASKEIMSLYNLKNYKVETKEDNSPVTTADLNSNRIIHDVLSEFKDIAFLSEEDNDDKKRMNSDYVFIVDPLDGTSDFVNRDNSFSINLALVYQGLPIISIIGLPYLNGYCYALKNKGAYSVIDFKENKLHVSNKKENLILVESMTHTNEKENEIYKRHKNKIDKTIKAGASTKAYLIASSQADVSIRYTSMTKEWDTCACDLIITESGGYFTDTKLKTFTYNKKDVYNHDGYCMFNCKENFELLK